MVHSPGSGWLGRLESPGNASHRLGAGSAPHGVIVGPDGAPWITDGGLNAIVRVDPATEAVQAFPLPAGSGYANLNTATFDGQGTLWFTGQSGVYGRLDPAVGQVEVFEAPGGRGPYGIATTPAGKFITPRWQAATSLASIAIRRGRGARAANPGPGSAPGMAGFEWPDLGERMECRTARHVRSGDRPVAGVAPARR
jgi:streptogramin lyase